MPWLRAIVCVRRFVRSLAAKAAVTVRLAKSIPVIDGRDMQALSVREQVSRELLVCPVTRRVLKWSADGSQLLAHDSSMAYRVLANGTPVMVHDEVALTAYSRESKLMNADYASPRWSVASWITANLRNDFRTKASRKAFCDIFDALPAGALAISPGGGPVRFHQCIVNVNIGSFENVDVVADAHQLPYADGSVDAVHSEAVFEHLAEPRRAAQELFRVMKSGARGFVCTPFLQQYHGYPHHYQNFTLQGHRYLFESIGFKIISAGHAVGPVVGLTTLIAAGLRDYVPRPLNRLAWAVWSVIALLVKPLDRLLEDNASAHALASTTYVVIQKP